MFAFEVHPRYPSPLAVGDQNGLGWFAALAPALTGLVSAGIGVGSAALQANIGKKAQLAVINAQTASQAALLAKQSEAAEKQGALDIQKQAPWVKVGMVGVAGLVGVVAIYFLFRTKRNPYRRVRRSTRRRRY